MWDPDSQALETPAGSPFEATAAPGAEADPMQISLLAGLLEQWEQLEEEVPVGGASAVGITAVESEAADGCQPEWEVEGPSAADLLAAFELPAPVETALPDVPPVAERPRITPAAERSAARREGILRLLAAMYPEAARNITGQAGITATAAPRRPASDGFVVFHLAGESFALGLSQVVEADRVPALTPVPFVPEFVRGLTNRRGEVLPLIDLRLLLGLKPGPDAGGGRMLVVRRSESDPPAAFLVDGLGGIAWFDHLLAVRLSSQVAGRFPELLRGSGQHRNSTVHVMDVERLFARKELEALTAA